MATFRAESSISNRCPHGLWKIELEFYFSNANPVSVDQASEWSGNHEYGMVYGDWIEMGQGLDPPLSLPIGHSGVDGLDGGVVEGHVAGGLSNVPPESDHLLLH
jgi:hypothetical protein